jgi:hypothetical protein
VEPTFLALYRGPTISEARLIAVSSEPEIVGRFICELAGEGDDGEERESLSKRESLHLVRGNVE